MLSFISKSYRCILVLCCMSMTMPSTFAQATWQEITPSGFSGAGYQGAMASSGTTTLYVANGSNIEKSTDAGQTFSTLTVNFPVAINQVAVNGNNVWICGGNYVSRSADGGQTWITISHGQTGQNFTAIHLQSNKVYVGSATGVLLYDGSQSSATSLNPLISPTSSYIYALHDDGNNILRVLTSSGLHVSTDGAANWNPAIGTSGYTLRGMSVDGNNVYLVGGGNPDFILLRNTIGTHSFAPTTVATGGYCRGVYASNGEVWVGGATNIGLQTATIFHTPNINTTAFSLVHQANPASGTSCPIADFAKATFTFASCGSGIFRNSYTINHSAQPTNGGTTSGYTVYAFGNTASLTATPNSGYTFDNWTENGIVVSSSSSYSFTVANNRTLIANFSLSTASCSLDVLSTGNGTAAISGFGSNNITTTCGSTVTITASPAVGYEFDQIIDYDGIVVATSAPYTFQLNNNEYLQVFFRPIVNNCSLDVLSTGNGTAAISGFGSNNITTTCGSTVTITATPAVGYEFDQIVDYDGIVVATSAPYTFQLNNNEYLQVFFRPIVNNCSLDVLSTGNGTAAISGFGSNNITTACESTITVIASPAAGYVFDYWLDYDGNIVSNSSTYNFALSSNTLLSAYFTPIEYTINAAASPMQGGQVYFAGTYSHGDNVNLIATPNTGYNFVRWQEGATNIGTSPSLQFIATSNRTLTAIFQTQAANSTLHINGTAPSPNIGVQNTTNFTFQANVPNASSFTNLQAKIIFSAPDGNNYEVTMTSQGNGNFTHTQTLQQIGCYNIQFQAISNSETANSLSYQITIQRACNPNPINDYPYSQCTSCVNYFCTNDGTGDIWNMIRHQCTSWVMWRLNGSTNSIIYRNNMFGSTATPSDCNPSGSNQRLSHACRWDNVFAANGVSVNQIPAVGAIAHWDANENGTQDKGHVAYVECVNGSEVTISEFNWIACSFGTRIIRTDLPYSSSNKKPGRYIHVEADGLGAGDYGGTTNVSVDYSLQTLPFQLSPNPSSGLITLQNLDAQKQYNLTIFNALGQEIVQQKISNAEIQVIDLSAFGNGLYFVNLQSSEQTKTFKLILQQ